MKFIVNNKIYDTDKAELIAEGYRKVTEHSYVFGCDIYPERMNQLYKTAKGAYFFTWEYSLANRMQLVTEDEAKSWLMRADYSKYAELFGELEEG